MKKLLVACLFALPLSANATIITINWFGTVWYNDGSGVFGNVGDPFSTILFIDTDLLPPDQSAVPQAALHYDLTGLSADFVTGTFPASSLPLVWRSDEVHLALHEISDELFVLDYQQYSDVDAFGNGVSETTRGAISAIGFTPFLLNGLVLDENFALGAAVIGDASFYRERFTYLEYPRNLKPRRSGVSASIL